MSRGGRRRGRAHLPIESCHSMSAWGYFQEAQMWQTDLNFEIEWRFYADIVRLTFNRQGIERSQDIRLRWTPCNYGGMRPWFLCPDCTRRVAKVYLPETMYLRGNAYTQGTLVYWFKCRYCYDLTYLQRQQRDQYWTYLHRADRIGDRWLDVGETTIEKRKGQHYATFQRRAAQYQTYREIADTIAGASLEGLLEKFQRANP